MATKVIFRRVRGRIIAIRANKSAIKTFQGPSRNGSSRIKKQLRRASMFKKRGTLL